MVLDDSEPTVVSGLALAHMAVVIAQARKPLDALRESIAAESSFVTGCHLLEDEEKEFLWCGGAVKLLRGLEEIESDGIARGREEVVRALSKAVELEGPSASLRLTPGIEEASLLEVFALLLHAHVGHLQAICKFANGEALAALELIKLPARNSVVVPAML